MAKKAKRVVREKGPQEHLPKWQQFYRGEALLDTARGGLVRFLRWDGQAAVVGDMVLGELPGRVPAAGLVRPSTLPDAGWLAEVRARG